MIRKLKQFIMKNLIILIGILCISSTIVSQGQINSKKVLIAELQGEYRGQELDGLANGEGSAMGENIYIGEFKNGYPHGEGKYIWAGDDYYVGNFKKGKRSGFGTHYLMIDGKSSYIEGHWKNDRYIGKYDNDKGYKINRKFGGIERISYIYKGIGGTNEVSIKLMRSGASKKPLGRSFYANSGDVFEVNRPYKYGILNMEFPFTGQLLFYVDSKTGTSLIKCELDFELTREGSWDIIIYV